MAIFVKFHDHIAYGVNDVKTLKEVVRDNQTFELVCPKITHRIKLLNALKQPFKPLKIFDGLKDNLSIRSSGGESVISDLTSDLTYQSDSDILSDIHSDIHTVTEEQSIDTQQIVIISNENENFYYQKLDIFQLLNETIFGKALLSFYDIKKQFDSKCQSFLCDIIVSHYLNQVPLQRLTNRDFDEIAQDISKYFPNELKEVYYIPPIRKSTSRENKSGIARGKLVDKYRNKLTFLRKAKILPTRKDENSLDNEEIERENAGSDVTTDDLVWLRNNTEPWEEVIEKWEKTASLRDSLLKTDANIVDILEKFPIIKHSSGYILIECDFKRRYPVNYNKLYTEFEDIFNKVVDLRKHTLSQSDALLLEVINGNSSIETKHYLMVTILSALLPYKAFKRSKTSFKPNINEIREEIIVHVKVPGDIPSIIEGKKEKLVKLGLPSLPFVVTEGPSYMDIKKVYVSFGDILYSAASILKAIDICFMLFHVLNLKYPSECEHFWLFVQLGVYKLKTVYDNIPSILDLVNKVNLKS